MRCDAPSWRFASVGPGAFAVLPCPLPRWLCCCCCCCCCCSCSGISSVPLGTSSTRKSIVLCEKRIPQVCRVGCEQRPRLVNCTSSNPRPTPTSTVDEASCVEESTCLFPCLARAGRSSANAEYFFSEYLHRPDPLRLFPRLYLPFSPRQLLSATHTLPVFPVETALRLTPTHSPVLSPPFNVRRRSAFTNPLGTDPSLQAK